MTEVQRFLRLAVGATRRPLRAATGFLHPDYPLVMNVQDPTEASQRRFALLASELVSPIAHPDVVAEAGETGLTVYARYETALDALVATLASHFAWNGLRFGVIRARCWPGVPNRWPVMALRIDVPRLYAARVRFDLLE